MDSVRAGRRAVSPTHVSKGSVHGSERTESTSYKSGNNNRPNSKPTRPDRLGLEFSLYIVLAVAQLLLIWLLPFFPTQDGPSHLYNLVILDDLLHGGKAFGEFYTYSLQAVPNLGFHILAYPLLQFLPPLVVERIFLSVFVLLLSISIPIYLRSLGRPSFPMSFFIFPLVFNFSVMKGFYSFVVAIPLMFLAMSISWKIQDRSLPQKTIVLNVTAMLLFYFHLIPFCIFLMSVFLIGMAKTASLKSAAKNVASTTIVLIPSIALLLSYIFFHLGLVGGGLPDWPSGQDIPSLGVELLFFSIDTFSRWQIVVWVPFFILYYMLLRAGVARRLRSGTFNTADKYTIVVTACLVAIYLFAPSRIGSGSLFNVRLPWLILLLSLPILEVPSRSFIERRQVTVFAALSGVFLLLNSILLFNESASVREFTGGVGSGVVRGPFIMTYREKVPRWARVDPLLHAASYYGIAAGCVDVGNYEVGPDYFQVRVREGTPAFPPEPQVSYAIESLDLSRYTFINELLGWEIGAKEPSLVRNQFEKVWHEGKLSIWRRTGVRGGW